MNPERQANRVVIASSQAEVLAKILKRAKTEEGLIVTCVGPDDAPADVLTLMTQIGRNLSRMGAILRSSGANSADLAFEAGWRRPEMCEIYHPWHGYRPRLAKGQNPATLLKRRRPQHGVGAPIVLDTTTMSAARDLARSMHPAWSALSDGGRSLQTRNVPMTLGVGFNRPSDLFICWTSDGLASGGMGQAMRFANKQGIEIINLKKKQDREALLSALEVQ